MKLNDFKQYAPLVLRIGIGFVFIWFGLSGLTNTSMWVGLVPSWTNAIASPSTLVYIHSVIELVGGLLVCAGYWLRPAAAILFLSLAHTLTLLDFGPIYVRDIGLALATLAIFLDGENN